MGKSKESKHFKCKKCNKTFRYISTILQHAFIYSKNRPFTCKVYKNTFKIKSNLKKDVTHNDDKPFEYSKCDKYFKSKYVRNIHLTRHGNDRPFRCSMCNKSFKTKSTLHQHMFIHEGNKKFTCSTCNKSFKRKSNLERHAIVHLQNRPFSCHICTNTYKTKSLLTRHEVTHTFGYQFYVHTGVMLYKCNYCDSSFSHPDNFLMYEFIQHYENLQLNPFESSEDQRAK